MEKKIKDLLEIIRESGLTKEEIMLLIGELRFELARPSEKAPGDRAAEKKEKQPKAKMKPSTPPEPPAQKICQPDWVISEEKTGLETNKELPLPVIYKGENGYYRSRYKQNGLTAVGVVVPYLKFGREFILDVHNQPPSLAQNVLKKYARSKTPIGGRFWGMMTPEQQRACQAKRSVLSPTLRAIGGDLLLKVYVTDPYCADGKPTCSRLTVDL